MTISEAGRRSGCSPPTIRYYESIGLLAPTARTAAGRRTYGRPEFVRLTFIRRSRDFGLSIPQVRELLAASEAPATACSPARSVVAAHLETIKLQRAELRRLETSLQSILMRCESGCASDADAACTIFGDIANAPRARP